MKISINVRWIIPFKKFGMVRVNKSNGKKRYVDITFHGRLIPNLLNYLNGIIYLTFLELSIIIFRDIDVSANSIGPRQTSQMWLGSIQVVAKTNNFRLQQDKG